MLEWRGILDEHYCGSVVAEVVVPAMKETNLRAFSFVGPWPFPRGDPLEC